MSTNFPHTLGIEEEYLLVDIETRQLAVDPPKEILEECQKKHEGNVSPEFLRSQIEVGTPVCGSIKEAHEKLRELRASIIEVAAKFGYAPIACSTHPFSRWRDQKTTVGERYRVIEDELQGVIRRLATCGMHVHVGIENNQTGIDLMNQIKYFLPHLLSFSTSSPFWCSLDTGLKSYRLTVFDSVPRTGLPAEFQEYSEYQRYLEKLVSCGVVPDASKIWWDLRLSANFPTLEMRIADTCTRLEDAMAVATLYWCLHACFYRLRDKNQQWRVYPSHLIKENRWRAQRYGLDRGFVHFGREEHMEWPELLDGLEELLGEDAERLGCTKELAHLRTIYERGTSAHRQTRLFKEWRAQGMSEDDTFRALVDDLIQETRFGVL
jgi:glutamate---cysteine ligase / carboxylate-amine ligase